MVKNLLDNNSITNIYEEIKYFRNYTRYNQTTMKYIISDYFNKVQSIENEILIENEGSQAVSQSRNQYESQ